MNKEILNYLARVDTYYQSVQVETKLTITQTYDSREKTFKFKGKTLFTIRYNLHKILMPIIMLSILTSFIMMILVSIQRDAVYGCGYTIFVLSTLLSSLSIASEINRKYDLHKLYLNTIDENVDMNDMAKVVFTKTPNNEQILYLKEIVIEHFQRNKTNRNVFIACLAFLVVILKPITDELVKLFLKNNSNIMTLIVLITTVIVSYLALDKKSKLVQPDSWLIRDYDNIIRFENLLNYLIYQSK
ncbi:hypothetical protein KIJ05_03310 [Leuconostoc gelidum subsp. gasicomitatum]|uniref:hypothetical protein n=1 Tax=Leuconostoc gasicomitatum TaxID=115778 RepID=UPI001CC4A3BC|nr:hypothetical protein [Leuconostoc gasicomitatum]MBZ5984163.1 hypothetical protein [Leuconostoc gasicomitatum]